MNRAGRAGDESFNAPTLSGIRDSHFDTTLINMLTRRET